MPSAPGRCNEYSVWESFLFIHLFIWTLSVCKVQKYLCMVRSVKTHLQNWQPYRWSRSSLQIRMDSWRSLKCGFKLKDLQLKPRIFTIQQNLYGRVITQWWDVLKDVVRVNISLCSANLSVIFGTLVKQACCKGNKAKFDALRRIMRISNPSLVKTHASQMAAGFNYDCDSCFARVHVYTFIRRCFWFARCSWMKAIGINRAENRCVNISGGTWMEDERLQRASSAHASLPFTKRRKCIYPFTHRGIHFTISTLHLRRMNRPNYSAKPNSHLYSQ